MPDDAFSQVTRPSGQPEITEALCVHSLSPLARCQSCVDACPRAALILDDESLGLDGARCDGCGLCAAACPEAAIAIDCEPALRQTRDTPIIALAACAVVENSDREGVLPCLHALGLHDLWKCYRAGARRLVVAGGDCGNCPRGGVRDLREAVGRLGALLRDRGEPRLQIAEVGIDEWRELLDDTVVGNSGPRVSRRRLFSILTGGPVEETSLPAAAADALWPVFPEIDVGSCNGCLACIHICPHGCLELARGEDDEPRYVITPDHCTGCGLCTDVCAPRSVGLVRWAAQQQREVPLRERTCRLCGNLFRLPQAAPPDDGICPICAPRRKGTLFQVLD